MTFVNENYLKLKAGYLFPEIAKRVREFSEKYPDRELIRLGIGDVVLPLPLSAREAMKRAVDELGDPKTFRGYGPEQGYSFLREAIAERDYRERGAEVAADEIFVSDGSKCDTGNIQELFAGQCRIGVTDPVYPVYVDTNVMAGRTGESDGQGRYQGITYLPAMEQNRFVSKIPKEKLDLVYLCSPNNPTGTVLDRATLTEWVRYATENRSVILFDAAYESFVRDESLPRSIYEIPGARKVAAEFRSFSKTAGFTGVRCAFTVVPKELTVWTASGSAVNLRDLWLRRQSTKFNGVSYPVQRAAEALYTQAGREEIRKLSDYYLNNAHLIKAGLSKAGLTVYGGDNAPYVWVKTPRGMGSWEFFDWLLNHANVVGTPGAGFGPSGEGYFRLSAFNFVDEVERAIERTVGALSPEGSKSATDPSALRASG